VTLVFTAKIFTSQPKRAYFAHRGVNGLQKKTTPKRHSNNF